MSSLAGIVLAAGAGRRNGRPKALERTPDGTPWQARAVDVLRDAGCDPIIVALGARANEARALTPPGVTVVVVDDWAEGMSRSLHAGLEAAFSAGANAALVTLVDLPHLPARAAHRVAALARSHPRDALARAVFGDGPGHPVVIGRNHWPALGDTLTGDRGARDYLRAHSAARVDCTDLTGGDDIDVAADTQGTSDQSSA